MQDLVGDGDQDDEGDHEVARSLARGLVGGSGSRPSWPSGHGEHVLILAGTGGGNCGPDCGVVAQQVGQWVVSALKVKHLRLQSADFHYELA